MDSRIREMKFENGARAIGAKTAGGTTYLVSTTKTNGIVEFFGKLLCGPLERKQTSLKGNEFMLVVRHNDHIVNYYIYEKLPLFVEQAVVKQFKEPSERQ